MGSSVRKRAISMSRMNRKLVLAALKVPLLLGVKLYTRLYCSGERERE